MFIENDQITKFSSVRSDIFTPSVFHISLRWSFTFFGAIISINISPLWGL